MSHYLSRNTSQFSHLKAHFTKYHDPPFFSAEELLSPRIGTAFSELRSLSLLSYLIGDLQARNTSVMERLSGGGGDEEGDLEAVGKAGALGSKIFGLEADVEGRIVKLRDMLGILGSV